MQNGHLLRHHGNAAVAIQRRELHFARVRCLELGLGLGLIFAETLTVAHSSCVRKAELICSSECVNEKPLSDSQSKRKTCVRCNRAPKPMSTARQLNGRTSDQTGQHSQQPTPRKPAVSCGAPAEHCTENKESVSDLPSVFRESTPRPTCRRSLLASRRFAAVWRSCWSRYSHCSPMRPI